MIGRFRKEKCLLPPGIFGSEWRVTSENIMQMKTTLLALVLLCATGVQAQLLIYKRTVHSTVMGHGFTTKSTVTGYLVVDANSGSAAEFDVYSKTKEFLNRGKTFTAGIVHGGQGKDYVVFGDAAAGTDRLGRTNPHGPPGERASRWILGWPATGLWRGPCDSLGVPFT
jgi:hypothetical protein